MKRLGLAALLATGMILSGSTTTAARAQSCAIELTNIGDEPEASGAASLKEIKYSPLYEEHWRGYMIHLSVRCKGLTPGAMYQIPVGTFIADQKGTGQAEGITYVSVYYNDWTHQLIYPPYYGVQVARLNPDGSSTPVLTGTINIFFIGWTAYVSSATFGFSPPVDPPEPRASGQWTLRHDSGIPSEDVMVSCRGLTPDGQYAVVVLVCWSQWDGIGSWDPWPVVDAGWYYMELAVTADAKGRLNTQFTVESDWSPTGGVYRTVQGGLWIENDTGNVVLQTQP